MGGNQFSIFFLCFSFSIYFTLPISRFIIYFKLCCILLVGGFPGGALFKSIPSWIITRICATLLIWNQSLPQSPIQTSRRFTAI